MAEEQKLHRTATGRVVSSKAEKTISVSVQRQVKHPIYGKYLRRSTKILAHDESNQCREGDLVTIQEGRPISARKNWVLVDVLEKAPEA